MTQFTPEDYVNAIVSYEAKYLYKTSPEEVKEHITKSDLEFALGYEDQYFPLLPNDKKKVKKTPEDTELHCSITNHWMKMDVAAQQDWYKEMCKILQIDYDYDSEDDE